MGFGVIAELMTHSEASKSCKLPATLALSFSFRAFITLDKRLQGKISRPKRYYGRSLHVDVNRFRFLAWKWHMLDVHHIIQCGRTNLWQNAAETPALSFCHTSVEQIHFEPSETQGCSCSHWKKAPCSLFSRVWNSPRAGRGCRTWCAEVISESSSCAKKSLSLSKFISNSRLPPECQ